MTPIDVARPPLGEMITSILKDASTVTPSRIHIFERALPAEQKATYDDLNLQDSETPYKDIMVALSKKSPVDLRRLGRALKDNTEPLDIPDQHREQLISALQIILHIKNIDLPHNKT